MNSETGSVDTPQTLPSGDWYVDPARSRVHFHTRAFFGLFPVLGRFEGYDGVLHVDDAGQATGELRIEAASIRTGIGLRDAHLRTKGYFHAGTYPDVTFDLTGLARGGDGYEVTGTLRIRETTLPIRAPATISSTDSELRMEARFPLDHDAAGLRWAKPGMVAKVVDADINLTLTRERSHANPAPTAR